MQSPQKIEYSAEIEAALRKAKCKKVLYLYDESGEKQFLGVFGLKKASEIKRYFRQKNLIGRLSEFEVRTTEPDSQFNWS